jgi:glutaminase
MTLPSLSNTEDLQALLEEAVERGRAVAPKGELAGYIPELLNADPAAVGIALAMLDGRSFQAGDARTLFTIQSVSKVFTLACVLRSGDTGLYPDRVSVEPSGDEFHSITRLEEEQGRPRNPMINAGAIAVSGRLAGQSPAQRIDTLRGFLTEAGNSSSISFPLDDAVYRSECRTGFRNRALANFMQHHGVVDDAEKAVDTYFRQCSLLIDAEQLAQLGLFLANGGVHPVTGKALLSPFHNRIIVATMMTCGLYDEVGHFAIRVGLPAKSGVSGGILAVLPGRMSIACYGPALGTNGNSMAGMAMLAYLSERLRLSLFEPAEVIRQDLG